MTSTPQLAQRSQDEVAASRVVAAISVVLPAAVSLVLVVTRAAVAPMGQDEGATRQFAAQSVPHLWDAVHTIDGIFFPYYLLMHAVTRAGDGLWVLRLPSIVGTVVAVVFVVLVARHWWGWPAGLLAGLALGVNPLVVELGAFARPYALALAAAAASTFALARALDGSRRAWPCYAVLLALTPLLQLLTVLFAVGHLPLLWRAERRLLGRWLVSVLPAAVVAAGLAVVGGQQLSDQIGFRRAIGPGDLLSATVSLVGNRPTLALCVLAALLGLVAAAPRRAVVAGIVIVLGPIAIIYVDSLRGTSMLVERYLIVCSAGAALVLGAGASVVVGAAARIRVWPVVGAAVVAVVVILAMGRVTLNEVTSSRTYGGEASLAQAMRTQIEPGDTVVFASSLVERGFAQTVAYQLGDGSLAEQTSATLPHPPAAPLDIRRVVSVEPFRTAARAKLVGRVWLPAVARAGGPRPPSGLAALMRAECTPDGPFRTFGNRTSSLRAYRCARTLPAAPGSTG